MRSFRSLLCAVFIFAATWPAARAAAAKPPLTLTQFFNAVSIGPVRISPDGRNVVIQTSRADWAKSIFSKDLWLYREGSGLIPLTQSERDTSPQWSPDGRWIAFLSTREKSPAPPGSKAPAKRVSQVYVIRADGGEAVRLTSGSEAVHSFAWSADSREIFYSTRQPWTKAQEAAYKKKWHDTIQYRKSERGDLIRRVDLTAAGQANPPAPVEIAATPFRVRQMAASPDGRWLALVTGPPSLRIDDLKPYGIDLVDLSSSVPSAPRVLMHQTCIPEEIEWSPDGHRLFFAVEMGTVEGPYEDVQPRAYSVDPVSGTITRWAAKFGGGIKDYAATSGGGIVAAGRIGTEVQVYTQTDPQAPFREENGLPGTYQELSAATHSPRVAFVYSTLQQPTEVYVASSPQTIAEAHPITSFNEFLTKFALPEGHPVHWKADDGTTIEGMLLYPPGKNGIKHLPMFTFIHGGPEDADGNHFEADWYQWAALAATQGWLVFEPNYRGSTGYGDKFVLQIVPDIVSRPGKDILEGIDSLVREGIADPNDLAVGGYSYGGYMTDWLITQTTRFKAAVTGAGAIENAVNWGNDDMSFDDAYMLAGLPWTAKANYLREAALWHIQNVTTPTHIVAGKDDIRVYVGEDYLLERCLFNLHVPHAFILFPGEGHGLSNNPWHGRIKVREELKWLAKYGLRPRVASTP